MDRQKAEGMLADATAELRTLRSQVSYLEQVVSGLEGLLQSQPLPSAPQAPAPEQVAPPVRDETDADDDADEKLPMSSNDVVLTVLRSHPNRAMPFPAIWLEIQERGLADPTLKAPRNTYGNAAQRLADDPNLPVVRADKMYMYRTDLAPSHSLADSTPASRGARPLMLAGTEPAWQEASS